MRRLSELTGNSQSAIIGDLLDGTGPVFDRMIQVLEAAKTATDSMKGRLANDMEHAQGKMENALGIVLEGFQEGTASLFDEVETVTRRGRRRVDASAARAPAGGLGAALPTPISNRGVRFTQTTSKTIAETPLRVRPKAEKSGAKIRGGK